MRVNFADIYLLGMRDRSMLSGGELRREIQLIDWSTGENLSNRSSFWALFVLCEAQLDNKFVYLDCTNRIYVFCTVTFRDIAKSFVFIERPLP